VSLVEQELLTIPEHPSSLPVFSEVRITRSLDLYACFVDRCLSLCTFFCHCVVCSSSSREWGKDREVFTTSGTYPWSFVTQIFHNDQPSHGGDRQIFEVMTVTLPKSGAGTAYSSGAPEFTPGF
jgi:hypothetical protein